MVRNMNEIQLTKKKKDRAEHCSTCHYSQYSGGRGSQNSLSSREFKASLVYRISFKIVRTAQRNPVS